MNQSIFAEEVFKLVERLQKIVFNVRVVVSNNHANKVAAFRDRSAKFTFDGNKSKTFVNSQVIYMFYDTVDIFRSLRNNLLCWKRFLFPPFR